LSISKLLTSLEPTLLSFKILLGVFLLGFLIIFSECMIDNRIIFSRPLSPEELFKEFGPKVEQLFSTRVYRGIQIGL